MSRPIIENAVLTAYCRAAGRCKSIAMDTEFVREDSYHPHLETMQINAAGDIRIIDIPAVRDLSPLWNLMRNPAVEKVIHSAEQDLEMVYRTSGFVPEDTFDSQIAAAFLGYGDQISYGQLVEKVVGVTLDKSETRTNWARRPLTDAQTEYALDDVRYLPRLADHLKERLAEKGRTEWAEEEFRAQEQRTTLPPPPPEMLYRKVRGAHTLAGAELAILRTLCIWRDDVARERNRPARLVLKDEVLVRAARKRPATIQEIKETEGFPPHAVTPLGRGMLEALREGAAAPAETHPEPVRGRGRDRACRPAVAALQELVKARAEGMELAASLLTNAQELSDLAAFEGDRAAAPFRVLQGWRRDVIGQELLAWCEAQATTQ